MKKRSRFLFILCLLAALVCIVSTTAFATYGEPIVIEQIHILVDDLVPGQPLPTPSVPEDAPYTIDTWSWNVLKPSGIINRIPISENATDCVSGNRYELHVRVKPLAGYAVGYIETTGFINGTKPNGENSAYFEKYDISHVWSFRTVIDRVELNYEMPPVGAALTDLSFTCNQSNVRLGDLQIYTDGKDTTTFVDHWTYKASQEIFVVDGYEFSDDVVFVVNGVEAQKGRNRWDACTCTVPLDYTRIVETVEFPAFPETAAPGPGGISEVIVPENADYTMQQVWMDMRTGETVETMVSGEVYTLSYIAVPKTGFHFTDETTYTLGGEPCEAFGDEQYRVLYKSYDLGAQKIDRVNVNLPVLHKGCTPGNATIPTGVNYELWEVIWAESTTDSFEDALPVQVADFGTNVYAVPVLCAAPGYTFAEDVKLYFNGVEVTVAFVYAEGPMLEIAGLYGTLTPPTTDGWHQEDNTWAYYVNGQKRTSAWIADSVGWCYVGSDGLMVKNGWAKDSVGWCYLGADGYMVKNRWAQDSIGWCYLNSSGYMVYDKWIRDSVDWCYVGSDGYMCTDRWIADSVGWCYVGSDGYMLRNAWAADSVGVCRLNQDGYIVYDQWINDGYGWAYVDSDGYAVYEGWQKDSRGWCYIYSYYMITDTWFQLDGKVYYVDKNGYRFTNGRKQYNAYYYYVFDSNGVGTRYTVIA